MNKLKIKPLNFVLVLLMLLGTVKTYGQVEPIMTQYMFNIQPYNPAYAGMWEKIGFSSLVRKQWVGINRSPLTQVISFHSPFNTKVGLGLNVTNDVYALEKKLGVFGDYAYEIAVAPRTRLRLGLKVGFHNYSNPLPDYRLDPNDEYDQAFAEYVDLQFLPNFGVGAFLYEDDYYIGLSMPKMLSNGYKANLNIYNTEAQLQSIYLTAGCVFRLIQYNYLIFKPTLLLTANIGLPVQYDIGTNFLLYEQLWLGMMMRSGNALSFVSQWLIDKNLRIGFAMDVAYNELFPHQYGTYELSLGFSMDFFGRSYIRAKYF